MRRTVLAIFLLFLAVAGAGCGRIGDAIRHRLVVRATIFRQPASHAVVIGQTTNFKVLARGLSPVHYQWLRNGTRIPGASADTYTIPSAANQDDGARFQVIVSNWRATVTSDVAQLRVISPQPPEASSFPLKVSPNGRYLVDQNDRPFRIQGESAWSLIANLTYGEADRYLDNRRAKGFNTVLVQLIEHRYAQGGKGANLKGVPANRNGDLPFTRQEGGASFEGTWGTADFSMPNEAYFAFADSIIDLAAKKGMLVQIAPMFLGFNGKDAGWWADLTNTANTQDVVYRFGLYIGNRYKNRQNIVWIIGGDYFPPPGSEGEKRLLRLLQGIKAGGAKQLWSGDWKASSLSVDEEAFAPYMDLNAVYTYGVLGHGGATYDEAKAAYAHSPAMPAYLKETGYENERIFPGDPASVRMYEYYAILGGATEGAFFGNRDIWKFATNSWWSDPDGAGHGPWMNAMESRGTFDFVFLGRLLDSLPWFDLVPSGVAGMKKLITAGAGNYSSTDFVVAAATRNGTALIAYIPPRREGPVSFAVDMTALRGPSRGQWFDPVLGTFADIAGGDFPNSGTRTFAPQGLNAAGDADWVLILRAK